MKRSWSAVYLAAAVAVLLPETGSAQESPKDIIAAHMEGTVQRVRPKLEAG